MERLIGSLVSLYLAIVCHDLKSSIESGNGIFKTTKFLDFPWPLDFSEQIAEEFKNKYKEEIMELEILEKQFADGLYSGDLILSKEQEIKLKPILKILDISYSIIP